MMSRPKVGITLGDPRGIGPEIIEATLADPEVAAAADFTLIGPGEFSHLAPQHVPVGSWSSGGTPAEAGHLAGAAIERAVQMALAGDLDAIVTAPIDKAAFKAGGWEYPGHTEMLGELTDTRDFVMLMAAERTRIGGSLRVVLATTHHALRSVPSLLTADVLVRQSAVTWKALRDQWGIDQPKLALCAFNPHASDGGLFGDEEERIYQPALERLEEMGMPVVGPVPADTVFSRALTGEFDAVIAPYHDVGMAPFKTISFGTGVNVTLGLPFPRTSPDHGTALDIAGKGVANASSMIEATRLAIRLGGARGTSN